jgi:hypothetical protein
LEAAAADPVQPTNRNIMDASDTRQTALQRLGQYYQRSGDPKTALIYYSRWRPGSWCGTCAAQMAYERDLFMAQCLVALNRNEEALAKHLMPHLTGASAFYSDHRVPSLVVEIHERAGTLDRLMAGLPAPADAENRHMGRIAGELAQIRVWRREGKISRLLDQLVHEGGFVPNVRQPRDNWRAPAAARALSEFGGREFSALRQHYETLLRRWAQKPNQSTAEYGTRLWVMYAIGLSKSLDARAYIRRQIEEAKSRGRTYAPPLRPNDLEHILSLGS